MLLCICKGVSESHVKAHVSQGVCTMQKLSCQTGLGTQCGVCRKSARQLLNQMVATNPTTIASGVSAG
ncbi:(2Fe-2S)-binding protein [Halioxenophilus sp. WMMB6]|uniref:(2Fe-2S)-binding protein n=1 Tax=Halioxenophilus sp. WMMB6 TaxID=3073815 RepID=UPI00398BBDBD